MTDLYANALEQDADDDADVVDSWMLYLRAPALTLDASEVLQSLVQITQPRATVRPGHFDSRPSDPVVSSASFPFSAIVRPPRQRLHRVLERAGRMNIS